MNHTQAATVIREAFRNIHGRWPTETERALAQAIAHFETLYGRGGQFATWPDRGLYNWGNVEARRQADGSCGPGYEPGQDEGPVCFRVFSSDVEAATHYLRVLSDPAYGSAGIQERNRRTLEALGAGDPYAVAHAMKYPPAYYGGDEGGYGAGVATRLKQIDAEVPRSFTPSLLSGMPWGPLFALTGLMAVTYVAVSQGHIRLPRLIRG